jgi:mutual gliding-motility protein MglA
MASVNPLSRELVFKIVYYGPGLGGKTTTLEHIHATAKPEHRGKLVSLATPVDRTLYFDFLPVRLPAVRGMHVRLQLFTVPGQVHFNATRKLVLTGADGIIFVSDSQLVRADANLESLENLRENLAEQGRDLERLPLAFQHNKRDLPDLLPLEELDGMLNPLGAPTFATSAKSGRGVYEALEAVSSRVMAAFESKLPESSEPGIMVGFEAVEGGLAMALRNVSQQHAPPSEAVVAHITGPGTHVALPLDDDSAPPPPPPPREVSAVPRHRSSPPLSGGVSFAELWPEAERELARQAERAIAAERFALAIEICDELLGRVIAAAVNLIGAPEGPASASSVVLLLGLDGQRYLALRAALFAVRGGMGVTARDALHAYAFAVEARLALDAATHGR